MSLAAAIIIGILTGCAELFLLTRLVCAVSSGNASKAVALIPVKLLLLFAVLLVTALIEPYRLWIVGTAAAAVLIFGGLFLAAKNRAARGGNKK